MFSELKNQIDHIEKSVSKKDQALKTANNAMQEAQSKVNETVHFIRQMDEGPMTQNERLILKKLYNIARILNEAAVSIRFDI